MSETRRKLTPEEARAANRLSEIYRAKKKELGLTQQKLADRRDVTQGAIHQWMSGKVPIGLKALLGLASDLQVTPDEIFPEIIPKTKKPLHYNTVQELPEGAIKSVILYDSPDELPDGEFVMIDRLDVKAACGSGYENGDYPTMNEPMAFRADFIKRSKAASTQLVLITISGTSMMPGLFDGDDALLDCAQDTIKSGKVYAFCVDGEMMVKRLFLTDGKIIAHSDNEFDPAYKYDQEYELDSGIRIIGRVVNRSGSGGL